MPLYYTVLYRELYVLLGEKIKPLLVNANGSTGIDAVYSKYTEAQSIHKADILKLLQFYQSTGDKVGFYCLHSSKLMGLLYNIVVWLLLLYI